jgi:hypothetical protein
MLQIDVPAITIRPRGFFTFAQNTDGVDYVRLAYALALSLKASQSEVPYLTIGITPGTVVPKEWQWAFDNIIDIPWGDDATHSSWKLENEWKAIHMSPYDRTIKLDCDMLFFNDIGSWWHQLEHEDFFICNRVLDYRADTITDDRFRKVFTQNNLPNVYTGFMYFTKTDRCFEIFHLAKMIYWNWETFFSELLKPEYRPNYASTDVIFALVIKILDLDQQFYTENQLPTFTHMKSELQGWYKEGITDDWTKHMNVFFNPALECKIGNYLQFFPLHYHVKHFVTDELLGYYEEQIVR